MTYKNYTGLLISILIFSFYGKTFATSCAEATVINTLPFSTQLVCTESNDISSDNATTCINSTYYEGNEALLRFTPSQSGAYLLSIDGVSFSSIVVYQGCPTDGGLCVDGIGNSSTSKSLPVMLDSGLEYFIMVDVRSSSVSPCAGSGTTFTMESIGTCPVGLGPDVFYIPSLPYFAEARSTCEAENNLNNSNTINCGGSTFNQEEEVLVFTPDVTDTYHIIVDGTSYLSLTLTEGCPLFGQEGVCVASTSGGGNLKLMEVLLESGVTYYLIVSRTISGCVDYEISIDLPATCPEGLGPDITYVPSLPYNSEDRSTCGAENNLNNANTINCGGSTFNQEEEVLVITPDVTDTYQISVDGTSYLSLTLIEGCPLYGQGGECIASTSGGATNKLLEVLLESDKTYYLIVSRTIAGCVTYNINIDIPPTCPEGLGPDVTYIESLPYFAQDRSTCGAENNLNNVNTINCGGSTFNQEEEVLVITPDVTDTYQITVDGTTYLSLTLIEGCPLYGQGGECIASTSGGGTNKLLEVLLESNKTYYLIVSRTIAGCVTYNINIDIPPTCPEGLGPDVTYIASLPYFAEARSTCGAENNLNNVNTINCGGSTFNQEEEVLVITPDVTDTYQITVDGTTYLSLTLIEGCPLYGQGGECIASTSGGGTNKLLEVLLESNKTYYLIVSRTIAGCVTYDINIDIPATCPNGLGPDVTHIPSLPFVDEGRSTCGAENNLNSVNTINCGGSTFNQEEEVLVFSPDESDIYHITVSGTTYLSLTLIEGCPLFGQDGICIDANSGASANKLMEVFLESNKTYYLIVSRSIGGCVTYNIRIDLPATCPDGLGPDLINIQSIPYHDEGRSTCEAENNLFNANTINCDDNDFEEQEEVFVFSPETTDTYHIQITGTSYSSLALFEDCPLIGHDGICIDHLNSGSSGEGLLEVLLEAGSVYYLVVSRSISGCIDYDISITHGFYCPMDMTVCVDDSAFILDMAFPDGGTYSGEGVYFDDIAQVYMFDPSLVGADQTLITYEIGGDNPNTCDFLISIDQPLTVECPDNLMVQLTDEPFVLSGATPEGGSYTGDGIDEGLFSPAAAGLGVHQITYSITNACGTFDCSFTINVSEEPPLIVPGDANCDDVVDVLDVITIINFVLELNPDPFCPENADVNMDYDIDVLDAVATINLILSAE